MCPLTRVPLWYRFFEPQPHAYVDKSDSPSRPGKLAFLRAGNETFLEPWSTENGDRIPGSGSKIG